jgi:hypothetical protein
MDLDADPVSALDPALFVGDLQDASKKIFFTSFFCLFLFEGTFFLTVYLSKQDNDVYTKQKVMIKSSQA